MPVRPQFIPTLRYDDAPAAIDFLCDAFGFTRHAVFANAGDPTRIDHAELRHGDAVLMLGSAVPTDWAAQAPLRSVGQAGGNTQTVYVVVDDVDAHADRARVAGADIFVEPHAPDYGGRVYGARDPEGYAWSFGSYDPLAGDGGAVPPDRDLP